MKKRPLLGLFIFSMSTSSLQAQADETREGFVEGGAAKLIARNMYFNRNSLSDYPDSRGWGQGFQLDYQSGFTCSPPKTTTNHDEGFMAGYAGVDAGDLDYAGLTYQPVDEGSVAFSLSHRRSVASVLR